MARFTITDPKTGQSLKIEGDSPPTESEIEELFATQKPFAGAERPKVSLEKAGVSQGDINQMLQFRAKELQELQDPEKGFLESEFTGEKLAEKAFAPFAMQAKIPQAISGFIEGQQVEGTERRIKAADAGLQSGQGVSLGGRAIESLAATDKDRALAVKSDIDSFITKKLVKADIDKGGTGKNIKANVQVGKDPKSGEMVYLDPTDNKLYTTNPIGLDAGDFSNMLGTIIVAVPEIAGTVLGAKKKAFASVGGKILKKGSVKKELAGGAVGAGIGEVIRLVSGKWAGINKELTADQIAIKAGTEMGISTAGGAAMESLVKFSRFLSGATKEAVVPKSLLKVLNDDIDKIDVRTSEGSQQAIDAINKVLIESGSNKKLKPNLGQMENEEQLLNIVQSIRQADAPESQIFAQQERDNLAAQKEFLGQISERVTPQQPAGASQIGQDVTEAVSPGIRGQEAQIEAGLGKLQSQSETLIESLPSKKPLTTGQTIKGVIEKEQESFKTAADAAYTKLDSDTSALGIIIDSRKFSKQLKNIDSRESGVKTKSISDVFKSDFLSGKKSKLVLPDGSSPPTKQEWTYTAIQDSIRDLREQSRLIKNGQSEIAKGKVTAALGVLEGAKYEALKGHPEMLLRVKTLDASYQAGKEILYKGIAGDITKLSREGVQGLADSNVFKAAITGGDSNTGRDLAVALSHKPEAMSTVREGINQLYKSKVIDPETLKVDPKKHAKFIKDYVETEVITPFYKPKDLEKLNKIGGFGRHIEREQLMADESLKRLNKLYGTKLEGMDGRAIMNGIWGGERQIEVKNLKNALRHSPEVFESVKAEVLDTIKKTVMKGDGFSVPALENILSTNKGTMKELFGQEYVTGLEVLKQSLDVTKLKGKSVQIIANNAFMDLTRAYVGVFTRPGRVVTAANRFRATASRQAIAEMLADPTKIKKLHALRRARPNSRTAALLMGQIGATGFYTAGEADESDFRSVMDEVLFQRKAEKQAEVERRKAEREQQRSVRINQLQKQQQRFR